MTARAALLLALLGACSAEPPVTRSRHALPPPVVPADNPTSPAKVELGRLLFHDPILSTDRQVACVTCHGQIWGLSDGLQFSVGVGGIGPAGTGRHGPTHTRRNSGTLWNAAYRARLFWDGRADSLEAQALGPMREPTELGRPPDEVARDLAAIPAYAAMFRDAFPGDATPVTGANLVKAIATFERTLVSDYAPYDRLVDGDPIALDARATQGLALFRALRCDACHAPPLFESERYEASFAPATPAVPDDGRFEVTHLADDRGRYRVPTLRNASETAPYFHNGATTNLADAVSVEAANRPGARALSDDERDALTSFLRAGLTDRRAEPERPDTVPSGLMVPVDGYRIPR